MMGQSTTGGWTLPRTGKDLLCFMPRQLTHINLKHIRRHANMKHRHHQTSAHTLVCLSHIFPLWRKSIEPKEKLKIHVKQPYIIQLSDFSFWAMHLFFLCQPVSRQTCLRNPGRFTQFCYGKEWRISLWSFKAKYRKRMWGIIDTSKNKDGEYIREQFHLTSPSLSLVSCLFHWK